MCRLNSCIALLVFFANVNTHQKHTVPCCTVPYRTVLYCAQAASINALLGLRDLCPLFAYPVTSHREKLSVFCQELISVEGVMFMSS